MESPREMIGGYPIPRTQVGKAESEWILMTYLHLANERNDWRVPYPDLVAAYLELQSADEAPKHLVRRKAGFRQITGQVVVSGGRPIGVLDTTDPGQSSMDADTGLTFAAENGFVTIDDSGDVSVIVVTEQFLTIFKATLERFLQ